MSTRLPADWTAAKTSITRKPSAAPVTISRISAMMKPPVPVDL